MGGYDPKGREIVAAFAQVMNYLGTSYGVLKKEKCTGDPVRRLGNDLIFQQLAESNLEILAQSKVKKIMMRIVVTNAAAPAMATIIFLFDGSGSIAGCPYTVCLKLLTKEPLMSIASL